MNIIFIRKKYDNYSTAMYSDRKEKKISNPQTFSPSLLQLSESNSF